MRIVCIFVLIFFTVSCAAQTPDSTQVLARILAEKGLIGAADLARVEAAAPADGARLLARLLYEKGLLSEAEAALVVRPGAAQVVPIAARAPAPNPQALKEAPRPATATPAVTAQSKFPVTIYGTLLWNSFFNTAATNNQDTPLLVAKQGSDALGNDKSFGMTGRATRLGLRYEGAEIAGARVSGQFEFDLFGGKAVLPNGSNMDLFRLRLAFGRLDWKTFALEAGQDWSVFAPLNPTSLAGFAIPDLAASGNLWARVPQLRTEYRRSLSDRTRLLWQMAAVDPTVGDYPGGFATARTPLIGERGRAPGAESRLAFITHIADREASVGLSSHYSRGKNAGTAGSRTVQTGVDSWGVALDYSLPVHRRLTLSGEAYDGRALGTFSASLGQSVLPVGTRGEHGVESRGGWIQAQFSLAAKWQANLAWGVDAEDPFELRTGDRSKNQSYMANVFYKFTPHITMAWEWRRMMTDYQNQRSANEKGDHLNMAVAYIF